MEKENNIYKNRLGKQCKSAFLETKDVSYNSESRTISGYAAIFGNIDKSSDMLIKGCFAKSIQERGPESNANDKIMFLWMHDSKDPIGRISVLKEDERGLYFEAVMDKVENGDRAIKQLESGTLNQFSIGYRYVWEKCEWDDSIGALIVKEVTLYELSVVSIGANGETEYLGLKTAEDFETAGKELANEIDVALKGLSAPRAQEILSIITKTIALASHKSIVEQRESFRDEQPPIPREKKSMFNSLKSK
ncbi:hypothetical protein EZS27_003879 [termite gut metagenome]|uniref:Prohead serine protease domain-containing protein n=1 Tax=termite gut metagenome TaxID=433724 RepID=A0A5J4SRB9_9ZZZZ